VEQIPVINSVPVTRRAEAAVREQVERSPLLEGSLVSRDRRAAALAVMFDPQHRDGESMTRLVEAIRAAVSERPPPDGYRVALSGLPVIRVDIVQSLQADQRRLIPLAGLVYLIALGLAFRRVSGSLLPLLAVGIGLAWTLAAMALLDLSLNIISNVLPVMLMILGVSNGVHIISRYADETIRTDGDRRAAARRTMGHMFAACFLTMLTTAVGFGSLATARSDTLREFALQSVIGLTLLYVALMVVLGTLIRWFRPPRRGHARSAGPMGAFLRWTADVILRQPVVVILANVALVALAFGPAQSVEVNSNMVETFEEHHPSLRAMRVVERQLGGLVPLEISLVAEEPHRFHEADAFRKVAEAQAYALAQDPVLFARSYVDLHESISARYLPPEGLAGPPPLGAEGQERLDRSRRMIEYAAEEMGYYSYVTRDGRRARIQLRIEDIGTRRTLRLSERLDARLDELFPPESGIRAQITGDAYVNAVALDKLIRDLYYSLLLASVIIFVSIGVILRSLKLGLIATMPNLMPLALTLGWLGLRGYDLNVGHAIVFTISLGIAVDDTIHFLYRFREERAAHADTNAALRAVLMTAGRPIVLTSVLIVSGLAVLLLSDFVPTRHFAELTIVTMAAALIGDLFLLPALLAVFGRERRSVSRQEGVHSTRSEISDLKSQI
ncbi:MAG: efflux RND transporter permease subunit, partial [Planctomycetaceae bacterium]